jgi:hypothetical protein
MGLPPMTLQLRVILLVLDNVFDVDVVELFMRGG